MNVIALPHMPRTPHLSDAHGRRFPYLRLSLTEACNFRCSYCLPDGYQPDGRPGFLTTAEIARLVRAFAALGMHKIRLTGGEPSLRRDLPEIIATVATTPGIRTVALTTNGYKLPQQVRTWRACGLTALNVSLDSLQPARFHAITGHDRFAQVHEGIDEALGLGFDAVKVNAVLLRDRNDDELSDWMAYVRERPVSVRFIELMRTGDNHAYFARHHVAASTAAAQLEAAGWSPVPRRPDAGPACEYTHPDHRGRIGLIAPYAPNFCSSCNRLRVTARGDLRLCLFGNTGIPLRPWLQDDADRDTLQATIAGQLRDKAAGHRLQQGDTGLVRHFASIGG